MTFKQLIQTNTWPDISSLLLEIYPETEKNMEGYEMVFKKLMLMEPAKIDMYIDVSMEQNYPDEDGYIAVLGVYNNPKTEEEHYSQAIEFTPWRKWLGMDISEESLAEFSEQEIIVHCLYEMTFAGFSEVEIQKVLGKSQKSGVEDRALLKEDRYVSEASIEELFKELGDLEEDDDIG